MEFKFKKHIKRTILWLASSLITAMGLLVLGLNLLPLANPYLEQHPELAESFVKSILDQPVKIARIHISYKGLLPEIRLSGVKVFDDNTAEQILVIDNLNIDIDLLKSLQRFRLESKMLAIAGLRLMLFHNPDGHITIGKPESDVNPKIHKHYITIDDILDFFFTQNRIDFKNFIFVWSDERNNNFSINFVDFFLQPTSYDKKNHQFSFDFKINVPAGGMKLNALLNKPRLTNWLNQAFIGENNISGSVNIKGLNQNNQLEPQANPPSPLINIQFRNVNLNYARAWPKLESLQGWLRFDGKSLNITNVSGIINKTNFANAEAKIPDIKNPILSIDSKINSNMNAGTEFIKTSPLNNNLASGLKDISLQGPVNLALKLIFNLNQKNKDNPLSDSQAKTKAGFVQVDGDIGLQNNILFVPAWNISLTNLYGHLKFTEKTLTAKDVSGTLLEQPVTLNLTTLKSGLPHKILQLDIQGKNDSKVITHKFAASIEKYMHGIMNYNVTLKLHIDKNDTADDFLLFTTKLKNVSVALPPPFRKKAQESVPVQAMFKFKGKKNKEFTFEYDRGVTIVYSENEIAAKIDTANWGDWQQFIHDYIGEKNHQAIKIKGMILNISQFDFFGQKLAPAKINISPNAAGNYSNISIKSPNVIGGITLNYGKGYHSIRGNFEKLWLEPNKKTASNSSVDPKDFYALDISSRNFAYNNMKFGELQLNAAPDARGLNIRSVSIKSKLYAFNASGNWRKISGTQNTSIQGVLNISNLGDALRSLKLGNNVIDGNGTAEFNFNWQGEFFAPDLNAINGNVELNFYKGKIINLGQKAENELGIGRFLNLFSLQSIPRHLTLDFKDVSGQGYNFDKIQGNWKFADGNVSTNDSSLNGNVANIQVRGRIGLKNKDYDLKLYTTPHVTGNLPLVAAVAVQPAVGAAVWLVDQLLQHKTKNISKPTYSITGTWSHPKFIKL